MIDRLTAQGRHVNMTASEPISALVMGWWGFVLLPGGPVPSPDALAGLDGLISSIWWGAFALVIASTQLAGISAAWLGFFPPLRALRVMSLYATAFWFIALALGLALSGLQIAPVAYGSFAVHAALNARRAYLNGHGL